MDGYSKNLESSNKEALKKIFPQCFNDEGTLDIDKLLNLCGEYIDEDFEKYQLNWKGKANCYRVANQRSLGTLRPAIEESINFDKTKNLYIEGDNLEVLKLLQHSLHNQVKMIYIDPPYNTGNDFIYNDDFSDPIAKYKEITSQMTKSNPETMGRFHTDWLNMIYPRLQLASYLLKEDGVIFVSIDDHEVHNLRKVMDEVFGEENFLEEIIWQKAFSPKNDSKYFSNDHDYILCYAKNIDNFTMGKLPRTEEANARYKNYDNDPRGVWTSGDLTVKRVTEKDIYPIITSSGKEVLPPSGRSWGISKEKFQELVADNRIWFGEDGANVPRLKRFLHEVQDGMVVSSLWQFKDVGHSQEGRQELKKLFDDKGYFDGPKPVRLLTRILQTANVQKDDIILDFFAGSSTTAHAVMALNAKDGENRRFIMVQLPELCDPKSEAYQAGYTNICEIGKERIRRAGKQLLAQERETLATREEPLDVGFRVLKLDTSNFMEWDSTYLKPTELDQLSDRLNAMEKSIKPDRTDYDILLEVMLKFGINPNNPITPMTVGKRKCYTLGEKRLILVCLDPFIDDEDLHAMCDKAPEKIVASEETFKDDNALASAYFLLQQRGIEIELI